MRRVLALFLVVLAFPRVANAWEADVHWILTWWLAEKAGFKRFDAFDVADANVKRDVGTSQPATAAMVHVFLDGDEGASRDTRDKHFPTDSKVPADPKNRVVVAGSDAARVLLNAVIQAKSAALSLERLGEALHALQDSWSHQGIPDTPTRPGMEIRRELSWSHPLKRGGWYRHDADVTSMYPADAMATAKATYEAMVAFLDAHPKYRNGKSERWDVLQGTVQKFVNADTKDRKRAWLRDTGNPPRVELYLENLSIPGDSSLRRELVLTAIKAAGQNPVTVPIAVAKRGAELLDLWIRQQQITRASQLVDLGAIQRQFPGFSDGDARNWVRRFMTMTVAPDHGLMNQLGHADPSSASYNRMPLGVTLPSGQTTLFARAAFQATQEVVVPFREIAMPSLAEISFVEVNEATFGVNGFATVVALSNAPNDRVVIVLSNAADPRVIRLFSVIGH